MLCGPPSLIQENKDRNLVRRTWPPPARRADEPDPGEQGSKPGGAPVRRAAQWVDEPDPGEQGSKRLKKRCRAWTWSPSLIQENKDRNRWRIVEVTGPTIDCRRA